MKFPWNSRYFPLLVFAIILGLTVQLGIVFLLPSIKLISLTNQISTKPTSEMILSTEPDVKFSSAVFRVRSGWFGTTNLWIRPDDCLLNATLNNKPLLSDHRKCSFPNGEQIALPGTFKGEGYLKLLIENSGGPGGIAVTPGSNDRGWFLIILSLFFVSLTMATLYWLQNNPHVRLTLLLGIGAIIRVLYMRVTPFFVRHYDVTGHLYFIAHIFDTGTIPPVEQGWETHQAPLYYLVSAVLLKVMSTIGRSPIDMLLDLQAFSFLFEIISLGALLALINHLGVRQKSPSLIMAVGLVCILFPGLIILNPRISNDPLFYLLSVLSLLSLLRFHNSNDRSFFLHAIIFASLAFLTKITALIIILLITLSEIVKIRRDNIFRQFRVLALISSLFLIITGWFINYRFFGPTVPKISGAYQLNAFLRIPTTPAEFATFRPMVLIDNPFPRTNTENDLRKNYWEFLTRSALFGEFSFNRESLSAARLALALSLLIALLCIVGLSIRSTLFTTGAAIMLIIASIGYRILSPYAPNHDFRFITPIIVPLLYGLMQRPLRPIVIFTCLFFSGSLLWFWFEVLI